MKPMSFICIHDNSIYTRYIESTIMQFIDKLELIIHVRHQNFDSLFIFKLLVFVNLQITLMHFFFSNNDSDGVG